MVAKTPTATQLVGLPQEIALRLLSERPWFGLLMIDQRAPFQRSTKVLPSPKPLTPTAKQLVALGHAMPRNAKSRAPRGLGWAVIVREAPSQCSMNVCCSWLPIDPTAKQLVGLGQDTAARWAYAPPGLGVAVHRLPSQTSANVWSVAPTTDPPTAT